MGDNRGEYIVLSQNQSMDCSVVIRRKYVHISRGGYATFRLSV